VGNQYREPLHKDKKRYAYNHHNSIKMEQLDEAGTVLRRFRSMTEACKQRGFHT
jgi:hypothetical protein